MSNQTKRRISEGAEQWMGEVIPVLDHGSICLVDYMGDDVTVVEAARVSFGKQADESDLVATTRLIRYLLRNEHASPFEQIEMVFNVKAPIVVFREWHRHRTASLNEVSGRYTQLPAEYYIPAESRIQMQSKSNKQGSGVEADEAVKERFFSLYELNAAESFEAYDAFVEAGIAKELARIGLPLSTYSSMRWKCDLRNILHFLELRLAPNAQEEIRVYAEAMSNVIKAAFPIVYAAYEEYVLGAVTLSATERKTLFKYLDMHQDIDFDLPPDVNDVLTKLRAV